MKSDAVKISLGKSCCHEDHTHSHGHQSAEVKGKYFCPMCDGVESDKPGACPMCGMALERNPAYVESKVTEYTCPMHPEIRENHSGACPICGMALEPVSASAATEDDNAELRDMTRRFWIGLTLTIPVLLLSMGAMIPGMREVIGSLVTRQTCGSSSH